MKFLDLYEGYYASTALAGQKNTRQLYDQVVLHGFRLDVMVSTFTNGVTSFYTVKWIDTTVFECTNE